MNKKEIKYAESAIRKKDEIIRLLDEKVTNKAEELCREDKLSVVSSKHMEKAFLIVLIEQGTRIIQEVM